MARDGTGLRVALVGAGAPRKWRRAPGMLSLGYVAFTICRASSRESGVREGGDGEWWAFGVWNEWGLVGSRGLLDDLRLAGCAADDDAGCVVLNLGLPRPSLGAAVETGLGLEKKEDAERLWRFGWTGLVDAWATGFMSFLPSTVGETLRLDAASPSSAVSASRLITFSVVDVLGRPRAVRLKRIIVGEISVSEAGSS